MFSFSNRVKCAICGKEINLFNKGIHLRTGEVLCIDCLYKVDEEWRDSVGKMDVAEYQSLMSLSYKMHHQLKDYFIPSMSFQKNFYIDSYHGLFRFNEGFDSINNEYNKVYDMRDLSEDYQFELVIWDANYEGIATINAYLRGHLKNNKNLYINKIIGNLAVSEEEALLLSNPHTGYAPRCLINLKNYFDFIYNLANNPQQTLVHLDLNTPSNLSEESIKHWMNDYDGLRLDDPYLMSILDQYYRVGGQADVDDSRYASESDVPLKKRRALRDYKKYYPQADLKGFSYLESIIDQLEDDWSL